MEITIIKFTDSKRHEWDLFVSNSANGTFLHSRAFFDHNTSNQLEDFSLMIYEDDSLVALIPANVYTHGEVKIFNSHNRATYGGIIYQSKTKTFKLIQILSQTELFLKNIGIHTIVIRPVFSIYANYECDNLLYALSINDFQIDSTDIEFAIRLQDNFQERYADTNKRNVKKAKKLNLEVIENTLFEDFWSLLEMNLLEKHNTKPVHSLVEIKTLLNLVGHESIKLFSVYHQGAVIAGIVVFLANKHVVHAQYIASDSKFQEYRPLNLLIDHIGIWAQENNYKFFNLGMASQPNENSLNVGLANFKESFGAIGMMRYTWKKLLAV